MDSAQSQSYTRRMKMLIVIALLAGTQPAFAMNWEGHDDWMSEFPPVQAFIDSAPEAKPSAPRDCPIGPVARADNPYEQIPLPRHNCPAPPGKLPGN
jgi:hypothetical protein